jgi:hypothetical protein
MDLSHYSIVETNGPMKDDHFTPLTLQNQAVSTRIISGDNLRYEQLYIISILL